MVEPLALPPACSSAMASACGRPRTAVAPRPTTLPLSETITQPTLGLGALRPRAASPSRTASAMKRVSGVRIVGLTGPRSHSELLFQFLELPLLLLRGCVPLRLITFLLSDDLRVRSSDRPAVGIDDRRRRRGVDLGVDQEFDDDDGRNQHGQQGADQLLATALAHEGPQVREGGARPDGLWKPGKHRPNVGTAGVECQPPLNPFRWDRPWSPSPAPSRSARRRFSAEPL